MTLCFLFLSILFESFVADDFKGKVYYQIILKLTWCKDSTFISDPEKFFHLKCFHLIENLIFYGKVAFSKI